MLDVEPQNLLDEVDACLRLQKAVCKRAEEIVEGMVGYEFRTGRTTGRSSPENHAFEYVSLMLGRLVADNPAVALRSPMAQFGTIADALEDVANQWITRTNLQPTLEAIVAEMLIVYGVGKVGYEEDPDSPVSGSNTRRMRPTFEHIPYWRFFRDYRRCAGISDRLKGHFWIRDAEDLLDDPAYDAKLVHKLVENIGLEEAGEKGDAASGPNRHEIVGYEIWVPDAPADVDDPALKSKVHGMLYTLGVAFTGQANNPASQKRKSGYLRDPQPFFGPAWGPYIHFDCWPVPGGAYPLAPLMAVKEQAEEHNAQLIAITEAVLNRKTVIITGASNTGLRNTLKNARDGTVHGVKGYQQGQFDQVEIGGPTTQQLDSEQRSRDMHDRVLGMSDAQRGQPSTGVTASAENIAATSANIRNDTMSGFVKRAVAELMRSICWYMCNSEFFTATLSDEFSKKHNVGKAVFSGGEHPQSEGLSVDDLIATLDIQPFSMERVDPMIVQGRLQQLVPLSIQLAQAQATTPFADFQSIWESVAHAFNAPGMKNFINKEMLAQYMQGQSQMAQQQFQLEQQKVQAMQKPLPPQVPYDSAPADVKAQLESREGLQPSQVWRQSPPFDPNQPRQSGKGEPQTPDLAGHMMGSLAQKHGRAA